MANDQPEQGKVYSLTGENSIASGNSWADSVVKCKQCGNDNDSMVAYTKDQVCGKCTRKAQSKVVKNNPDVPSEVFEIEDSEEMAQLWHDMDFED